MLPLQSGKTRQHGAAKGLEPVLEPGLAQELSIRGPCALCLPLVLLLECSVPSSWSCSILSLTLQLLTPDINSREMSPAFSCSAVSLVVWELIPACSWGIVIAQVLQSVGLMS